MLLIKSIPDTYQFMKTIDNFFFISYQYKERVIMQSEGIKDQSNGAQVTKRFHINL